MPKGFRAGRARADLLLPPTTAPLMPLECLTRRLQAGLGLRDVQEAYLASIDAVVPARAHGLYHLDAVSAEPLHFAGRVPDNFVDEYERMGRSGDPVFLRAAAGAIAIDDSRALAPSEWVEAPVYDVLRRQGLGHSLEAPLIVGGALIGTLNLARRPDDPAFSRRDLDLVAAAGEHVQLALHRAVRFELSGQRTSVLEHALDQVSQAVVVSRLDGTTLFCNRAAASLARTGPDGIEPALVDRLLRSNLHRLQGGTGRVVESDAGDAGDDDDATVPVLVRTVVVSRREPAAVSFLSRRGVRGRLPVEAAPLTAREKVLVELVGQGLKNREIAERAFISENTVKMHLKRIFAKLGVRSRAELVTMVWAEAVSEGRPPSGEP